MTMAPDSSGGSPDGKPVTETPPTTQVPATPEPAPTTQPTTVSKETEKPKVEEVTPKATPEAAEMHTGVPSAMRLGAALGPVLVRVFKSDDIVIAAPATASGPEAVIITRVGSRVYEGLIATARPGGDVGIGRDIAVELIRAAAAHYKE